MKICSYVTVIFFNNKIPLNYYEMLFIITINS